MIKRLFRSFVLFASVLAGFNTALATSDSRMEVETYGRWQIIYFKDQGSKVLIDARLKQTRKIDGKQVAGSIVIGCEADSSWLSFHVKLGDWVNEGALDAFRADVLYRLDENPREIGHWNVVTEEHLDEIYVAYAKEGPTRLPGEDPKFLGTIILNEDAGDIFYALAESSRFYVQLHLEDGRLATRDFDISGSKEMVARMKEICGLDKKGWWPW